MGSRRVREVRVGRPRAARESKARDGGAGATSRGAEATVRRKRVRAWAGAALPIIRGRMHRRDRRSGSHDSGTGGGAAARRTAASGTIARASVAREKGTRRRELAPRASRARRNLRRPLRRASKEHARTRVRPRDHARLSRALCQCDALPAGLSYPKPPFGVETIPNVTFSRRYEY